MQPRCVRGESVHGMNRTELTSIAPSCSTLPPPRHLLTCRSPDPPGAATDLPPPPVLALMHRYSPLG